MTLAQVIAWHANELRRLEKRAETEIDISAKRDIEAKASFHWDAREALKWCVELPKSETGDIHDREFAFETLANECSILACEAKSMDEIYAAEEAEGVLYWQFFSMLANNCLDQHPTIRPARADA